MSYHSLEEIAVVCREQHINYYEAILQETCLELGAEESTLKEKMLLMWETMKEASRQYKNERKSSSGLIGGDGGKMEAYRNKQEGYCGSFMLEVMEEALKMGEANACMQKIVASPTAGSCGVLPAVLLSAVRQEDQKAMEALFVAAGIGEVIAHRAFLAGAAGGCQAEVGAASAMAAGALVYLKGGTPAQIHHAVAFSLKNMLGLVCDPVAGLVEVPCVKRNVAGAVMAVSSAEMALAGIESVIPADQMIDAMREVGEDMPDKYKETACGGCATTPRGCQLQKEIMGEKNEAVSGGR